MLEEFPFDKLTFFSSETGPGEPSKKYRKKKFSLAKKMFFRFSSILGRFDLMNFNFERNGGAD